MPRGYDLMIRVTYCVMVSSAGSLRRRPSPQALSFGVAVAHRMNLAPIRADGARRPIRVDDKLDRARKVSGVGAPFANDVRRAVQELDSVLHPQRSAAPSSRSSIRVAVSTPRHNERDSPPVRGRPAGVSSPSKRVESTVAPQVLQSGTRGRG